MTGPEKRQIVYREVSDLEPSRLPADHLLVKVGFSPDLPLYLRRLNDCLSRRRLAHRSSVYHQSQLESIGLELIPDSKQPKLTMETEYKKERKVRLDVFPGKEDSVVTGNEFFVKEKTRAMLIIGGQSDDPLGIYADTIGVVKLTDMQDFLRQVLPEVKFELYQAPYTPIKEVTEEPSYLDFLTLTQKEFDELEPAVYALLANRVDTAFVSPHKVLDPERIDCEIHLFRYAGNVPDVEKFMEGFADLLERSLPDVS